MTDILKRLELEARRRNWDEAITTMIEAASEIWKLREALVEEGQSSEKENRRKRAYYREVIAAEKVIAELRAENETLRRDVKTAVMGDSAELQDVKRENEKLRFERETIGEANYVNGWNDAINSSEAMQDLRAENEKLREALKPFAGLMLVEELKWADYKILTDDIRAAAAAIRDTE